MSFLDLAYIGPESIMPLGSILAALGGLAMIFWTRVRIALAWCLDFRRPRSSYSDAPHSNESE